MGYVVKCLGIMGLIFKVALMLPAHAADPPSHYRTYIQGPWGQIHVRVDGANTQGPTVVLMHQMVWSSIQFQFVQPALARLGVRTIAVDLPGYGYSDGPDHVPTADEYAETLIPVLDAFNIKAATLHGNHTGATIITAFALLHPDRVDRLIIQGPPIFDNETQQKLIDEVPFDQTPKPDGSHLMNRWRQASSSFGANTSIESQHQSVMQFFTAGPNEWYAHDAVFRYDYVAAMMNLRVPVMILTNPGDSLHQAALEAKKMRPDFKLTVLDWPGAHAIYDKPEPWAEAVATYAKTDPAP